MSSLHGHFSSLKDFSRKQNRDFLVKLCVGWGCYVDGANSLNGTVSQEFPPFLFSKNLINKQKRFPEFFRFHEDSIFEAKNRGRKSRDTVPLRLIIMITLQVQIYQTTTIPSSPLLYSNISHLLL